MELVLELVPADDDNPTYCGYYLVKHSTRTLYWAQEFDGDWLAEEIFGMSEPYQFGD